jgi:hypothetical protein
VKAAGGWKLVTNTTQNRPGEGKRSLLVVYKEPGKEEFSMLEKVQ